LFAAGPGGNLSGEVSVMSEHGGKSVVGEVADNLALGCGWVVVGALVLIDLFCWAAGWDFVAGALATALILGLTRGRK